MANTIDEAWVYEFKTNIYHSSLLVAVIAFLGGIQYYSPFLLLDKLGAFVFIIVALLSVTKDMETIFEETDETAVHLHAIRLCLNVAMAYLGYFLISQTCSFKNSAQSHLIYDVTCSYGNYGVIAATIFATFFTFSAIRVVITSIQFLASGMRALYTKVSEMFQ